MKDVIIELGLKRLLGSQYAELEATRKRLFQSGDRKRQYIVGTLILRMVFLDWQQQQQHLGAC